jgi:hypothetical protein
MQFFQLCNTGNGSLVPVESHYSLANSFLLSGRIAVLTGFLGLGDRSGLLGADTALGRLNGLGCLGRGGSTGRGRGARTRGGSLVLGLLSAKHALQTGGLVRRATVLILLEVGKPAGLGVDVCDLPLALCICIRENVVRALLAFVSSVRRIGLIVTYRSRPASCRWECW